MTTVSPSLRRHLVVVFGSSDKCPLEMLHASVHQPWRFRSISSEYTPTGIICSNCRQCIHSAVFHTPNHSGKIVVGAVTVKSKGSRTCARLPNNMCCYCLWISDPHNHVCVFCSCSGCGRLLAYSQITSILDMATCHEEQKQVCVVCY